MILARPPARRPAHAGPSLVALAAAVLLVAGLAPMAGVAPVAASDATAGDANAAGGTPVTLQPTVQYEEAVAHAGDKTTFAPGARVSVPFKPRAADRWAVGGVRPRELPAGLLGGKALRAARRPGPPIRDDPPAAAATVFGDGPNVAAIDRPSVDPASAPMADLAAAVDPGGLKREVFGFLPYWELTDSSTRLDWEKLSTIAYFGVGVAANGDLQEKNADGSTTVGWGGWTSAAMTKVMNSAHASGARVVLTIQSFAWTSAGVVRQRSLLGSAANRANLARQIAGAVRDRGADGVNLDFEPIISGYSDEFTALVRTIRKELNKVAHGYQVTFDATGWIGNYPIGDATASGGADAVVVMAYDYRTGSSSVAGSVAPSGGPTYDVADTIRAYISRIPASKIILGVPYYGRAWSTASSGLHAKNVSGTKNGASTTVVYSTAVTFAADHGRKWDPVEGAAWTAYRRKNCTAKYGCVNPWRELYYDDAQALGRKYDLINQYNLRGAGIWALGYDGTRTELYAMLKAKFITDKIPPVISGSSLSSSLSVTQRRRAAGHGHGPGQRDRPDPIWLDRVAHRERCRPRPGSDRRRAGQGRRVHLERAGRQGSDRPRRVVSDHGLDSRCLEQSRRRRQGRRRRPSAGGRHDRVLVELHLAQRRRTQRPDDAVDDRRFAHHRVRARVRLARQDRPPLDVHQGDEWLVGLGRPGPSWGHGRRRQTTRSGS